MIYHVSRFLTYIVLKTFFSLKAYGLENIPNQGPVIIACNHASNFDPFIAGSVHTRKIGYMAKEELFRNKFSAWYFRKVNAFPVDRSINDTGAFKEAIRRLKNREFLLMFPEGTRSTDGKLQEGKTGVAALSNITKAVVVPCYIKGNYDIWPKEAKFFKKGRLSVFLGKPMPPLFAAKNAKKADYCNYTREIMSQIKILQENSQKYP